MLKRFFFPAALTAAGLVALSCGSGSSGSGVVMEQTARVEVQGIFTGDVEMTQWFEGTKQASQTTISMTSPNLPEDSVMTQENYNIILLDSAVMLLTRPESDSTYLEMPFGAIRGNFEQMRQQFAALDTSAGADPSIKFFSQSTWDIDIQDSVEQQEINGFPCWKKEVNIVGTSEQLGTDTVFLETDIWYSSEFDQAELIMQQMQTMTTAIGVDPNWFGNILQSFVGQLGHAFADLSDELTTLNGIPIRTELTLEAATAIDPDAPTPDSLDRQDMVSVVVSVAKMYAQMAGMPAPTGHFQVLTLNSEVVDIRDEQIDPSRFEIPEGFVKQDLQSLGGGPGGGPGAGGAPGGTP